MSTRLPTGGVLSTDTGLALQDAIAALNSLQTNFAIINAMRQSGRVLNEQSIPETIEWCRKIGHKVSC